MLCDCSWVPVIFFFAVYVCVFRCLFVFEFVYFFNFYELLPASCCNSTNQLGSWNVCLCLYYWLNVKQGGTSCSSLQARLWGFFQFVRIFPICEDFWWSQRVKMRTAIGGGKGCPQSSIPNLQFSILSPQSSVHSPQKCPKTMCLLPKTWFTAF